jgi:PAS domain S-box-containing protein
MGDDDRFRQIFEAAPSALLVIDARGLVTLVNRRAERLFGYERAEILGQPVEMLVPERFRRPFVEDDPRRCRSSAIADLDSGRDLFGLRKDGSEVPVDDRGARPTDVAGRSPPRRRSDA